MIFAIHMTNKDLRCAEIFLEMGAEVDSEDILPGVYNIKKITFSTICLEKKVEYHCFKVFRGHFVF